MGDAATTTVSFRAMGTQVQVLVDADTPPNLSADVHELFVQWEATLSRFQPDSELSRLNARAGHATAVSPLLFRVMSTAIAAAWATGGAFDPVLGRQLVTAGYARSFDLPSTARIRIARPTPGGAWRDVVLDDERREVTVPRGCAVDLGGIAKGMAVDAAIDHLRGAGVAHALVNAGGDLRALSRDAAGWPVGLTDAPGQFLTLRDGAIATSSTARRRWRVGSDDQHHLIDPRSGAPSASGVWSVSVAAATCAQAEVAAKAALIMGRVVGAKFLADRSLRSVMIPTGGAPVRVGDWPSQAVAT